MGKTLEVVTEDYEPRKKLYCGRSAVDAPDIDGRVYYKSERPLSLGDFVNVKIEKASDYDLLGSVIDD